MDGGGNIGEGKGLLVVHAVVTWRQAPGEKRGRTSLDQQERDGYNYHELTAESEKASSSEPPSGGGLA